MVHRSRARSSSLFLMELILAILFFSVASAVCVEFFVKAHVMGRDSETLTHAVNECSGAAEILCTADSLTEGIELLGTQYPDGDYPQFSEMTDMLGAAGAGDFDMFVYYDDSYLPCEKGLAAYVMAIHLTQEGQMAQIVIEMFCGNGAESQGEPVYRLETGHHIARRTAFHEG